MGKLLSKEMFSYFWKNKLKPLLDSKVNVVSGKGLSTNDFTNADKAAIDSLEDSVTGLQNTKLDKTGTASSATRLASAVMIGSASFDGTKDISVEQIGAAAKEHTHSLPTLEQLGAAGKEHTHPLPTLTELGAAAENHTHPLPTLEVLGAYPDDNVRSMTFSVAIDDWGEDSDGAFSVDLTANVTENTWSVIEIDSSASDCYSEPIAWTTAVGKVVLSTAEKPTGPISGRMLFVEVKL